MSSTRKTKKRLKRELREAEKRKKKCGDAPASWENLALYDAAEYDVRLLEQELENLKHKN